MFVFSKGKPKTFNPIKVECKYAGTTTWGDSSFHKTNKSGLIKVGKKVINDTKIKGNVFLYDTAKASRKGEYGGHPAPFPKALANDHILSWSNEGDIVLDPFMESGTTGIVANKLGRHYVGIELNPEYVEMAERRIGLEKSQLKLF